MLLLLLVIRLCELLFMIWTLMLYCCSHSYRCRMLTLVICWVGGIVVPVYLCCCYCGVIGCCCIVVPLDCCFVIGALIVVRCIVILLVV